MSFFWENGFLSFLILTVILGGGAAYMSGRAVAMQWKTVRLLAFYSVLLTLAIRFLHFALFEARLVSLKLFVIDFIILFAIGMLGFRLKRVSQMVNQYRWKYQRTGVFWWKDKV